MNNLKKIKITTHKVAFLMHHQEILPDLKEIVEELNPVESYSTELDKDSTAYLLGAYDALKGLIDALEKKGPQFKE